MLSTEPKRNSRRAAAKPPGKENDMNPDFSIYKTQWGCCADEMRWACESNKNGMIYATFHTYEQAVAWCNKKDIPTTKPKQGCCPVCKG